MASIFSYILDFIFFLIPVVLPIYLIWKIFDMYVEYRRQRYWNSLDHVLLEVKPTQEMQKSPAAMELFLVALHQTGGEGTWIKKYIDGKTRPWFSLEIVSLGGDVHFYIWTQKQFKRFIESQMYSQYPDIDISESQDYSQIFDFNSKINDVWGVEFGLTKADPFPIKTYVDYELDKEEREESQIDPLSPMLELMSSLNPGEFMWFQYIIRAHKREDKNPNKRFGPLVDSWKDTARSEISKINKESSSSVSSNNVVVSTSSQTEGQRKKIAALEKSISKLGFDVGVRALYLADHESFDGVNRGVLVASMKQFNSGDLNGFMPIHVPDFDYPWQDVGGHKVKKMKEDLLSNYKDRKYFFSGKKHMVLNTEELATIFHFPGKSSEAPTISRVDSKKAAPPPNLPQ